MGDIASGAPFVRATVSRKRILTRLGIASFLASTILLAAPGAHARITQIQILNRAIAFGGYSFAGVGQYEFITGIATGEVSPTNPQNAFENASSPDPVPACHGRMPPRYNYRYVYEENPH